MASRRGETEENKVHVGKASEFAAQVSAKAFWLELGDIRRLVAAADEAEVPDEASFLIFGTSESFRREEFYVKHAHVRHSVQTKDGA